MSNKSKLSIITNGIIKENPVLVLLIGTCPTLATSSSASNGLGMGLSTTAVLIAANVVISLLRKVIPDKVRMGLGFTLTLTVMGTIRELLGAGTWFGMTVFGSWFTPIGFFNLAPGGFFVFGVLIAVLNVLTKGKALKKKSFSCGTCPMYNSCNLAEAKEVAAEEKGAEA